MSTLITDGNYIKNFCQSIQKQQQQIKREREKKAKEKQQKFNDNLSVCVLRPLPKVSTLLGLVG